MHIGCKILSFGGRCLACVVSLILVVASWCGMTLIINSAMSLIKMKVKMILILTNHLVSAVTQMLN